MQTHNLTRGQQDLLSALVAANGTLDNRVGDTWDSRSSRALRRAGFVSAECPSTGGTVISITDEGRAALAGEEL